jgi:murein DD-endopeptidase MepM/ murein hydrolase activator NlpD
LAAAGRLGCLIALLAIVACGAPPRPAQEAGATGVQVGPTVTVAEGDTVYRIAQRHDVPLRDLLEANNLRPPFTLRPGQVLRLPATREHIVQTQDTLSEIAERHGMSTAELAALNGIDPPYTIYVGQALRLPGPPPSAGTPGADFAAAPGGMPDTGTPGGQAGQPTRLAPNPGGVEREVLEPLPMDDQGEAGEAGPTEAGEAGPTEAADPGDTADPADPGDAADEPGEPTDPGAPTELAAAPTPPPRPEETAPQTPEAEEPGFSLDDGPSRAGLPPDVAPPERSGSLFQWPVRGRVLAGFGETTEAGRNEGINIAAERGAPILAAENGVVAYAGNELRGYGNLLLIRHADGWVTAYAHTEDILVGRGDRVTAGQRVATVGDTGAVSSPQLHFEIRQGSESVDPLDYLP